MKYNVPMPSLGADMDQGKLMEWLIKPGSEVKKGQTIAVVETTKSAVEIESFRDGIVLELLAKEGEDINVGKTIATFEVKDEKAVVEYHSPSRIKISPAAKRLAQDKKIDLNQIIGSGPDGTIELKDVQSQLETKKVEMKPSSSAMNLREAIAKAMSRSKKEIPHYYLKSRVSLDNFMQWIDEKNQILPAKERLLIQTVLLKAIAQAIQDHPEMNGYYIKEKFEQKDTINLGVAVSLKSGGVLVPAIMNVETKDLAELNEAFQDLLIRTRNGELKNRELTEGTITVTNVGDLGSDEVLGIIFPPQVALIGLGRIHKEAVLVDDSIRPGFVIEVTLSADHRVTDGLSGARFLASIEKYLLRPDQLEKRDEGTRVKESAKRDLSTNHTGSVV